MKILVTGGAGFIGSHFTKMALAGELGIPISEITVLDKLTYAGKMENFLPLQVQQDFKFVQGDISDSNIVNECTKNIDLVINFAAESHVDRSIESSHEFLNSNVIGVGILLEACLRNKVKRYLQVSTDEVYGTIQEGSWNEDFPLSPNSPYAASKAAGDLLAQAFHRTHKLDTVITRCSNNYGSHQDLEKLIPKAITTVMAGKKVPVYGDGSNIREWIHVSDHCRGIGLAITKGTAGEIYNIGSGVEVSNLRLVRELLQILDLHEQQVEFVTDRKGHDFRYSVDFQKITELGYAPQKTFEDGLRETVEWYKENYSTQS
jgi:dTDP-glucose 4,6-dehydratase